MYANGTPVPLVNEQTRFINEAADNSTEQLKFKIEDLESDIESLKEALYKIRKQTY